MEWFLFSHTNFKKLKDILIVLEQDKYTIKRLK